jgi:hypothetical protein
MLEQGQRLRGVSEQLRKESDDLLEESSDLRQSAKRQARKSRPKKR